MAYLFRNDKSSSSFNSIVICLYLKFTYNNELSKIISIVIIFSGNNRVQWNSMWVLVIKKKKKKKENTRTKLSSAAHVYS